MAKEKKNSKENDTHGMLITFSINSGICKSPSEKTKFFKQLYGWTQKIPGKKKEYEYHREGVLDEVPHKRLDQSAFIIPEEDAEKIMQFFDQWQKKVIFNAFKVLIEDQSIFDEFDKFRMEMEKEITEDDEGNYQGEPEEPEEPDDESKDEEEDEDMSDEEEAIMRRFAQWQKAKKN